MEVSRAFLTAVACLKVFTGLVRSVWMTATATSPLCRLLRDALSAEPVELSAEEERSLHQGRGIRRTVRREAGVLTAQEIVRFAGQRTLVVVNSVRRAQQLYLDVRRMLLCGAGGAPALPFLPLRSATPNRTCSKSGSAKRRAAPESRLRRR